MVQAKRSLIKAETTYEQNLETKEESSIIHQYNKTPSNVEYSKFHQQQS